MLAGILLKNYSNLKKNIPYLLWFPCESTGILTVYLNQKYKNKCDFTVIYFQTMYVASCNSTVSL